MRGLCVLFLSLALAAGLVLASSCGGGGGGGPAVIPLDPFNGTYHWFQHIGAAGPPLRGTAIWGDVTSDGAGMVTGGTSYSISNGVLAGPVAVAPFPYALLPAGRIQLLNGAIPFAEGGVSANGEHVIVGGVAIGANPSIALLTRPPTGMSAASLTGNYHYAQFFTSATGTTDGTVWGVASFDGVGAVNFSLMSNSNGIITGPTALTESYVVAPNGTVLFSVGALTFGGVLRQDGQVAFLGGSSTAGGVATLGILVEHSTAATNATLSGPYHWVGLDADDAIAPLVNWQSYTGSMSSDGAGDLTTTALTVLMDDGNVMNPPLPATPFSYGMAPNGGFLLGPNVVGAVSPDGSVAALVGGTTAGDHALLWVLLR